jgi:5-methylcytosine-specific restriction endonuclease McrA
MKKTNIQVGERFHQLVAIAPAAARNGKSHWVFACDCGNQTIAGVYKVKHGTTKSCGCLASYIHRDLEGRMSIPNNQPDWLSLAKTRWAQDYSDGCPFETFLLLSQKPCHYCGNDKSNTYRHKTRDDIVFKYNGLDRIDPTKNHSPDNIITCCWPCNRAKMDRTYQEFTDWIHRAHNHLLSCS